jgi:outer membrane protein TolC
VDVAVTVPIFTGGQREIDLVNSKYQIQEDKLDREKTAKTVESDVKQAWLNVKTLEGTLAALKVQVTSAEQSYHDLQSQYAAGAATAVDVLSGLNDLDASRRDLAIQSYQYEVALRNLEQVTGVFQEDRVHRVRFDR